MFLAVYESIGLLLYLSGLKLLPKIVILEVNLSLAFTCDPLSYV